VTSLRLSTSAPAGLKVDALVVGVVKGRRGVALAPGAEDVDAAFGGKLAATASVLGGTGAPGEVTKIASGGSVAAPVVVAVGLGEKDGYDAEALRRAAGAAVRALAGTGKVALALPAPDVDSLAAVAEGALLGAYAFLRYRTSSLESHQPPVEALTLLSPVSRERAAKDAVARAEILAAAVHLCRDLVNAPPRDLPPKEFATEAAAAVAGLDVEVSVLDEKALRKGGYGGIVGVGQGSTNPPRLVRLAYRHPQATQHLALVGKGITFDSGGLSLKPAQSMEWMKADMGGAAAVVSALMAVARLGLPVNVTAWAPLAENMPSGTAQRPSDVITIYGGKTVEVMNTDAEGRLVLADAIVAAAEDSPDLIVDVATLTGAQMIALGSRTSGVMSSADGPREQVVAAAERAGEAMWPMPLPAELRSSMDSEVADIKNIGDRYGGMLVAGLFLAEFVGDDQPWAHIDIAGPAFNEGKAYGYTPKGGTGAAVRTLVALAEELAAG
jgi:leucyl aminopeptidase